MTRWRVVFVLLAVVPIACSSVLGIEEAHLKKTAVGGAGGGTSKDDAGDILNNDVARRKPLCGLYCAAAMANCKGPQALYPDPKFCLAVCDALPLGNPMDKSGNTVGCRLHFAESAAAIEKQFNCSAAGPGGNDVCGSNCEGFCSIVGTICPTVYADKPACMIGCKSWPELGNYSDSIVSGNSVECRVYHSTAAAGIDPDQHCPHTDVKRVGMPCG
jgi:hypothetical protein